MRIHNEYVALHARQQVFFADFDGGRPKRVLIEVMGELRQVSGSRCRV